MIYLIYVNQNNAKIRKSLNYATVRVNPFIQVLSSRKYQSQSAWSEACMICG